MHPYLQNRIGDVMVSVLASSAVDRGFESNHYLVMRTVTDLAFHIQNKSGFRHFTMMFLENFLEGSLGLNTLRWYLWDPWGSIP
jgi:hypothetical protein